MASDRDIRDFVEFLASLTLLIMPDRVRNLPPAEQDEWVRATVRDCLLAHGGEGGSVDEPWMDDRGPFPAGPEDLPPGIRPTH